ncbi:siroheme synthase CysG [Tepidamorphus sp. 3E244]|uniref:siroheme synthase CysG n=1 Tax=Tepidamorphus sp. 3E244 TaxID=3385498 RepID=UPI0038FC2B87
MRHFPIYLDTEGQTVVVSGAGETAVAKLRLILKTQATVRVYGADPAQQVLQWAGEGKVSFSGRALEAADVTGARLLYCANDDEVEDARVAALGHGAGVLVNVVDNLDASQFITPAIVDRDPVTIAIGTEGAAPVLARRIKADLEARLDASLGTLARIGKAFRTKAESLPHGRPRREFWQRYYDSTGAEALAHGGEPAVRVALDAMLWEHMSGARKRKSGYVWLVGAGPGDPDLLTVKAQRVLREADVVIHDRLVSPQVLDLARREAVFVEVGKIPGGESWKQDDINALMVEHAASGAHVVRLKSGDPTIYGRLDEEMDALDEAGIGFEVVSGITSAIAGAARIRSSLTKRKRNSEFRFLTGQDVAGFAEHDWRALARPGSVAAIYMGVRASRFVQARLLMHGADAATPVTVIEQVSRAEEKTVATNLGNLETATAEAGIRGPAIIFIGLEPREAAARIAPEAVAVEPVQEAAYS